MAKTGSVSTEKYFVFGTPEVEKVAKPSNIKCNIPPSELRGIQTVCAFLTSS
jgi:hypothetical protein